MLQNLHLCFSVNKGYYFFGYTGSSAIEQVDIIYECIRDVLFLVRTVSVVRDRDSRDILLERETIELCKQPSRHGTEVKAQST